MISRFAQGGKVNLCAVDQRKTILTVLREWRVRESKMEDTIILVLYNPALPEYKLLYKTYKYSYNILQNM